MNQNFTSAATSINKAKLPAIYGKVPFRAGSVVLDYGCGRYTDHIRATLPGVVYLPYDKYNQTPDVNADSFRLVRAFARSGRPVNVVCSNVLNVIDSDDVVQSVMDTIANVVRSGHGAAYITVYEGDRSGTGRQTGPDSWQRNTRLQEYMRFVPADMTASVRRDVLTMTERKGEQDHA